MCSHGMGGGGGCRSGGIRGGYGGVGVGSGGRCGGADADGDGAQAHQEAFPQVKNKALSVTLDKKALRCRFVLRFDSSPSPIRVRATARLLSDGSWFGRDFVTGFHKRKKKRRKEAQKVLQEKERKKRIEERKRVRKSRTQKSFLFFSTFWFLLGERQRREP